MQKHVPVIAEVYLCGACDGKCRMELRLMTVAMIFLPELRKECNAQNGTNENEEPSKRLATQQVRIMELIYILSQNVYLYDR